MGKLALDMGFFSLFLFCPNSLYLWPQQESLPTFMVQDAEKRLCDTQQEYLYYFFLEGPHKEPSPRKPLYIQIRICSPCSEPARTQTRVAKLRAGQGENV